MPLKIYGDFECNVKKVQSSDKSSDRSFNVSYTENIKITFFAFLSINLCINDKFSKPIVLYRGKDAVYKFIEVILKVYFYGMIIQKK